jgi:hypothetical protein
VVFPDGYPEPNEFIDDQELCGVANASEAYLRDRNNVEIGLGGAWGWADTNCSGLFMSMCRLAGAQLQPWPAAAARAGCLADVPQALSRAASLLHLVLQGHLPTPRPPAALAAVPGPKVPYTSPITNSTYTLNTSATDFAAAEALCSAKGGHLASFGSFKEQKDVEDWMQASYLLLPNFHKVYWIGLRTNEFDWPSFRWLDATKPPVAPSYVNWGAVYYPTQVRAHTLARAHT